jgi:hypothetical protein
MVSFKISMCIERAHWLASPAWRFVLDTAIAAMR